jgi:Caspase domain
LGRHAVIVGINKYEDANLEELRGAENDAQEVMERLKGDDYAIDAFLKGSDATFLAVRDALSSLLYRIDKQDLALFYFSGHGFVDGFDDGYIAPFDVSVGAPWVRGISMGEIKELLRKAKNKDSVVVILDCCYSGKAADGSKSGAAKAPELAEQFKDVAEKLAGSGRVIIASSGKDDKSRERDDLVHTATGEKHCHGVFTHRLLEGLDLGATNNAHDCSVSLGALMRFLAEGMEGEPGATLYNSGLSRPNEIIILTRSRRFSLRPDLETIQSQMAEGSPGSLVLACQTLIKRIRPVAPRLDEVVQLTSEIERKIEDFKQLWVEFFRNNSLNLINLKADPQILRKQRDLVYRLDIDAFASMDNATFDSLDLLDQAQRDKDYIERYCDQVLKPKASPPKESAPPVAKREELVQGPALRLGQ